MTISWEDSSNSAENCSGKRGGFLGSQNARATKIARRSNFINLDKKRGSNRWIYACDTRKIKSYRYIFNFSVQQTLPPKNIFPGYLQVPLYNQTSTMIEQEQVFYSKPDLDWVNKSRTLVVSSRGMTARQRQFMLSLFSLMPHAKKQCKLEKQDVKDQIKELCAAHKTRYFMYFQVKKKIKFSLWLGRYPEGPSVKVDLDGLVTLRDVRFQGNSVKGARHIISFDGGFESGKMKLVKELLIGIFNVPKYHPKSTGVVDHVLNFTNESNVVSFRNYQIFREAVNKDKDKLDLYEIGPRCLMEPVCILDGVMGGEVLYRSAVVKKVAKKSKFDKRKLIEKKEVKPKNIFGQEEA